MPDSSLRLTGPDRGRSASAVDVRAPAPCCTIHYTVPSQKAIVTSAVPAHLGGGDPALPTTPAHVLPVFLAMAWRACNISAGGIAQGGA